MRARSLRRLLSSFAVAAVLIVALVGLAAQYAIRSTTLLEWPYDPDLYRDIASAQTMLDGAWSDDPYYRNESLWYNPLVPSLVALVSRLSGAPVHLTYTRGGSYFNLFPPLALALMVGMLLGPWAALCATWAFLFYPLSDTPPWASATYSPWLFPAVFAQGLFYLGLVAVDGAARAPSHWRYALAGLALGVTFLGHTAPALLLGSILVVSGVSRAFWSGRTNRREPIETLVGLLFSFLVAGLVSLPLTASIVGRYGLRILNRAPAAWFYDVLAWENLGLLLSNSLSAGGVLAAIGVVGLRLNPSGAGASTIWVWAAVNLLWLAYTYVVQLVPRLSLHILSPIPSYHLLFYWRAWVAVVAGYGVNVIGVVIVRRLATLTGAGSSPKPKDEATVSQGFVVVPLVLLSLTILYPAFTSRFDFRTARQQAWRMGHRQAELLAWDWIRQNTAPGTVFLASDDIGLFVIGPAGRKTVVIDEFFSNPYVDRPPRVAARAKMLDAIAKNGASEFCSAAERYAVDYVVVDEEASQRMERGSVRFLSPVFGMGNVRIWKVTACSGGDGPTGRGARAGTGSAPWVTGPWSHSSGVWSPMLSPQRGGADQEPPTLSRPTCRASLGLPLGHPPSVEVGASATTRARSKASSGLPPADPSEAGLRVGSVTANRSAPLP